MQEAKFNKLTHAVTERSGYVITPEIGLKAGFGVELKPRVGILVDGSAARSK